MKARSLEDQAREDATAELRKVLRPGMTVRTVLRHRAPRTRWVSLVVVDPRDGEVFCLDYLVSRALGIALHKRKGGIRVVGYEGDPGFWLVAKVGLLLWPRGVAANGGAHGAVCSRDGAYALKQAWM